METARSYQFRKAMAEKKQRQRSVQAEDTEEMLGIISAPEEPLGSNIDNLMQDVTGILRRHLQTVGTEDPWIINQANIYEKAVLFLDNLITTNPNVLPAWLQQSAREELFILAQGLEQLFLGQVPLRPKEVSTHSLAFEGYSSQVKDKMRRIIIFQTRNGYFSNIRSRFIRENCQIHIKNIKGLSDKGLVIADKDTEIRCGLRYNRFERENDVWTITLASGFRTTNNRWRVVRPLSQAIHQLKEQGVILEDAEHPYVFHYDDLSSVSSTSLQTKNRFRYFNHALAQIFQQLPQRQRIFEPGGTLEAGFNIMGL